MSALNSALTKLGYIAETVFGTTPATPAIKWLPHTGCSLNLATGSIEDDTITSNRQVKDQRQGNMSTAGEISVNFAYGVFDDFIQALLGGTWTTNVLNPGVTRRFFSILRYYTEMTGSKPYQMFRGQQTNALTLTVKQEQLVKAVFGMVGRDLAVDSAAPVGGSLADHTDFDNAAFDSFSGDLTIAGSPFTSATEVSLKIDNGMDARHVLFDQKTRLHKISKIRVTGSISAYFETSAQQEAFMGAEDQGIAFTLADPAGNEYLWELPRCRFGSIPTDTSGENDVMATIPFTALYDVGEDTSLRITRTAA